MEVRIQEKCAISYSYILILVYVPDPLYSKPSLGKMDRLCGLVVRVPGCITEMYCASCEVRTEFIYVM
jgi:hypothetical protein